MWTGGSDFLQLPITHCTATCGNNDHQEALIDEETSQFQKVMN